MWCLYKYIIHIKKRKLCETQYWVKLFLLFCCKFILCVFNIETRGIFWWLFCCCGRVDLVFMSAIYDEMYLTYKIKTRIYVDIFIEKCDEFDILQFIYHRCIRPKIFFISIFCFLYNIHYLNLNCLYILWSQKNIKVNDCILIDIYLL